MTTYLAAVGHGSTSLWYLTRATGLVSLVLLSATVVVGIVASMGWTTERWPRFLSQAVHRNLSLFCIVLVAVHVVTTVADGYVPISLVDAVIPFRTPYRPLWVGFGALAFDMLLAVAISSGIRRRIGVSAWRAVHWLAYLCWPIALVHGLGAGTDARLPGTMVINVVCVAAVVVSGAWRVVSGRVPSLRWRLGSCIAGGTALLAIVVFAASGPLRPGWSLRAGTSQALLAQLSHTTQPASAVLPVNGSAPTPSSASADIPSVPFSTSVQGTYSTSAPDSAGQSQVLLRMQLGDTTAPLVVRIIGDAVDGGVSMRTSSVTFGSLTGSVTALNGSTIGAVVNGNSGSIDLTVQLDLHRGGGTLSGSVTGQASR